MSEAIGYVSGDATTPETAGNRIVAYVYDDSGGAHVAAMLAFALGAVRSPRGVEGDE